MVYDRGAHASRVLASASSRSRTFLPNADQAMLQRTTKACFGVTPKPARARDSLMTWVTLSKSTCPPFFPLAGGSFDLARPLSFRGKKGVWIKQKCRGVHGRTAALLRGKSVTHVMRSCPSRAGERALAFANFFNSRTLLDATPNGLRRFVLNACELTF
jgi:hypothetical protein